MVIDLRSDTVTLPTDEMCVAMASASLGDDVRGEDPTVNQLQIYAADLVGKEAALFFPTGTMANLAAIMAHTPERSSEIIVTERSHILLNEAGGYAHVGGVSLQAVDGPGGEIDLDRLQAKLRNPDNIHHPVTRLVCMENTHNACGGTVISMENMAAVQRFTRANSIRAHLDGARIFNAAHVMDVRAAEIAGCFDSVMFCLSKGLSAPIGSMLAGSRSFISQANRMRKMLGGGMRQAGIAAAAGLIALKQMTGRLVEDHETARLIAEGIADCADLSLDLNSVQTNMVRFEIVPGRGSAAALIEALRQEGILALSQSEQAVRLVTHRHISKESAREAVTRILKAVSAL